MSHRPIADIHGYRGVEYGVSETRPGEWKWKYYPKIEHGTDKGGTVKGDRDTAVAAVKAAIDEWLGPPAAT
jgi:hypothetical protein